MAYGESDHETLITEKLDDIKDFLESFISNLIEQLEEKGGKIVPITSPVTGVIIKWYPRYPFFVEEGDPLCEINYHPNRPPRAVYSRYRGHLRILKGEDTPVYQGEEIGRIEIIIGTIV